MKKNKINRIFLPWKTELTSSAIIVASLALAYFFPAQDNFQNFSRGLFFLILLPILYVKFILKRKLSDYGFNLQNKKAGLAWSAIMLAASFLIIFLMIRFFGFDKKYVIPAYIAHNFWIFLFYELVLVNFLLFINEFFFKGFVFFTFFEKLGFWSVLIQFLLYVLFYAAVGSMVWQIAPMLILSVAGGIVTYKSRSLVYSYAMSLFFLIILDSYIIYLFK